SEANYNPPSPPLEKGGKGGFSLEKGGTKGGLHFELQTPDSNIVRDIAASFQAAVIDVLVRKTEWAIGKEQIRQVIITGGVAANSELRKRMREMGRETQAEIFLPSIPLCTDNAAMIAAAGYHHFNSGNIAGLDLNPQAYLPL
ncbi:MAG: carbamoyltransferase N-terminal domain-containing protein, partial [Nitrospirota bacterium]